MICFRVWVINFSLFFIDDYMFWVNYIEDGVFLKVSFVKKLSVDLKLYMKIILVKLLVVVCYKILSF